MLDTALTSHEFSSFLSRLSHDFHTDISSLAVAVSGGADSLALTALLNEWGGAHGVTVHALTVDHGLRLESADEAMAVTAQIQGFSNTTHTILTWEGDKPESRIQEEARHARYRLMADYCAAHDISHLFLAHHADDQAETVLFRLAKGSGLDGLSGMRTVQLYDNKLTLLRPLLGVEKSRLAATCAHYDLSPIEDPSNFCDTYARPRLREARNVLEAEGLSTKRLAVTALRLQRARGALDHIADTIFNKASIEKHRDHITLNWDIVCDQPEEIVLRVLIKVIHALKPDDNYLPRMEKIETLLEDLRTTSPFRKRTLGGLVFERQDKTGILRITIE